MTAFDDDALTAAVDAAVGGSATALETVLIALKDPLYRLSLRMLGNFADAEDATQEILIKIVTALASFEHRSSIRTWAFRVAVNHLRDAAIARGRAAPESLDTVGAQLEKGLALVETLADDKSADPMLELEAREVGLHCMQGILMCLDVDQRAAFVLSDVFDFDASTAAKILDISEMAYRQRLSRGRRRLEAFMGEHCGLVNTEAPCTCREQSRALRHARGGRPIPLEFTSGDSRQVLERLQQACAELSRLQRIALVFRDHPSWSAPETMLEHIRRALSTSSLLAPPGKLPS